MPFFSIIIPLYNKEDHIKETLESVLSQKEQDYEVIIIDDGSTDNSSAIVSKIKDHRIHYIHTENQGVSIARNLGIEKSTGQFIAFLDADDLWLPNHLDEIKKSISRFPKQHIFCNNYLFQLNPLIRKKTVFSYLDTNDKILVINDYFRSSLLNSIASNSSICIRTPVLKKGYLFDPTMRSGQDTDLWIRLGLTHKFVFNRETTAIYNKNISGSLSKTDNLDSRRKITVKFKSEEKNNAFLKKYIDQNRFSLSIGYKVRNRKLQFHELSKEIDFSNLNSKQKVLLKCPPYVLKILFNLKSKLQDYNIFFSVFK